MYTPILGTLGFILSPDGKKTLLVHRTGRKDDQHYGKYNGLGGKVEPGEDIITCMHREVKEEADILCTSTILRGTISWPGFGPNGEDWFGFIFLIPTFEGNPLSANEEGPLVWVDVAELSSLPMWEGDRYFLPLVFDGDPRVFHGIMPYHNSSPQSWSYQRV